MSYLVTNVQVENTPSRNGIYYVGNSVRLQGDILRVASSSHLDHDGFDDALGRTRVGEESLCDYGATFVRADLDTLSQRLLVQTDLTGFHDALLFRSNGVFVFSDMAAEMLWVLRGAGIDLRLSTSDVRAQLHWGAALPERMIIDGMVSCRAGSVHEVDLASGSEKKSYYCCEPPGEKLTDAKTAAVRLHDWIGQRFARYRDLRLRAAIGLSGGLDSRVAAYFACKNGFAPQPFSLEGVRMRWVC